MFKKRFALGAILIAGCTDLASISPGVCGNGVVEPELGEDCDGASNCTAACRFSCDAMTACPDGFGCGYDGTCRAATGTFTAIVHAFASSSMVINDVDGDGLLDVFGYDQSSIEVRYGAHADPLAQTATLATPSYVGSAAIGDWNGDGRADLLAPVIGGEIIVDTATGAPEQVVFPADNTLVAGATPVRVAGFGAERLVVVTEKPELQINFGGPQFAPCGTSGTLRGHALHPFTDGTARWIAPMTISNPGASPIECLAETDSGKALALGAVNAEADGETFAAVLDHTGNGCPTVFIAGRDKGMDNPEATFLVKGTGTVGSCSWDQEQVFELLTSTVTDTGPVLAAIGIPLAVLDGSKQLLVTSNGVWSVPSGPVAVGQASASSSTTTLVDPTASFVTAGVVPGDVVLAHVTAGGNPQRLVVATVSPTSITFATAGSTTKSAYYAIAHPVTRIAEPTRDWRFAATADFNGDGRADFAVVGANGFDGIEVMLQTAAGVFERTRIAIDTNPTSLATGDYDGDGMADVAAAVVDPVTGEGQVYVAFSNGNGQFTPLAQLASLPQLAAVATGVFANPAVPAALDHADDVLAAYATGAGAEAAIFYGAGDRLLSAPWQAPRDVKSTTSAVTLPVEALAFHAPDGKAGQLLMFQAVDSDQATLIYQLEQSGDSMSATTVAGTGSVATCRGGDYCPGESHPFAWRRTTGDLLLALRSETNTGLDDYCGTAFVNPITTLAPLSCRQLLGDAGDPLRLNSVTSGRVVAATDASALVMIDRNSVPGVSTSPVEGALFTLTDAPALALAIDPQAELAAQGITALCDEAAQIQLGAGEPSLAFACTVGKNYTLFVRAPTGAWRTLRETMQPVRPILRAGDFDGDGLTDLIYAITTRSGTELTLLRQCDAREAGCQ